jgi:hypothetical protein
MVISPFLHQGRKSSGMVLFGVSLQELTPRDENGRRSNTLHSWLGENTGQRKLIQHGLMKITPDGEYDTFITTWTRLPPYGANMNCSENWPMNDHQ